MDKWKEAREEFLQASVLVTSVTNGQENQKHFCSAQKQWHSEKSTPCPQHLSQKEITKRQGVLGFPFFTQSVLDTLTISGSGKCYTYCETGEFGLKTSTSSLHKYFLASVETACFQSGFVPTSKAKTRRVCCEFTTYFFITMCCLLTIIQPIFGVLSCLLS